MKHLEEDKKNKYLIQYLIQNRNKAKENISNIDRILQKLTIVDNKALETPDYTWYVWEVLPVSRV